jgi:serine protease inhibitor
MEKDTAQMAHKTLTPLLNQSGLTPATDDPKTDDLSLSKTRSTKKTKNVVGSEGNTAPITDSQVLNTILLKLLGSIVEQNPGSNVIASPLCLYWCFTMIAEGLGAGKTLRELQTALGFGTDEIIGAHLAKMILSLSDSELVVLKIASSIFTNKNVKIKPGYLELLRNKYKSNAKSLDFSKPETVDEINQQISDSTDGLVSGAISQLNPTAFSMIVASIYFKGQWLRSFSEEQNFQHDFKKADKTKVNCTFMANKTGLAGLHTSTEYEYLALTYKDEQTKLVIEMAKDGILKKPHLQSIIEAAIKQDTQVEVFIPKFKSVFTCDVIPVMKNLGIQKVFAASKEFTNITDHQMCVNNVLHTACIQVDEVGTEAFCFVMMEEIGEGATTAQVPKFIADKPFYFHIVDSAAKIILFSGTVEEPRF